MSKEFKKFIWKILGSLRQFSKSNRFGSVVAVLAGLDAYILIIPIEILLVSSVLTRKKSWLSIAFQVAFGSAVGATLLCNSAHIYGDPWIEKHYLSLYHSKFWVLFSTFLKSKGAFLGIALVSISPFPQQAAIALAGLAHTSLFLVFSAVFLGRFVKYVFVARSAVLAQKMVVDNAKTPFWKK